MKKIMNLARKIIVVLLVIAVVIIAVPFCASAKEKVKLNKKKVVLFTGKSTTLKLKGNKKKIKWTSSNKKIATVSSKGKVRAKKKGKVTITAKVGKKKYNCKVRVKEKVAASKKAAPSNAPISKPTPTPPPAPNPKPVETPVPTVTPAPIIVPTKIMLNKTSVNITLGDEEHLTVSIMPENATEKTVTWSSSDTSIVTVSDGTVKTVSVGTATITAKIADVTAQCEVTVTPSAINNINTLVKYIIENGKFNSSGDMFIKQDAIGFGPECGIAYDERKNILSFIVISDYYYEGCGIQMTLNIDDLTTASIYVNYYIEDGNATEYFNAKADIDMATYKIRDDMNFAVTSISGVTLNFAKNMADEEAVYALDVLNSFMKSKVQFGLYDIGFTSLVF